MVLFQTPLHTQQGRASSCPHKTFQRCQSHVGGLLHRNPVYFHSCILVVPYKGPAPAQEPLQRVRISVIDHSAQLQMDDAQIYSTTYSWRGATWFCDLLQKEGCWWVYLKPSACSLNPERPKHLLVPKSSITEVAGCGAGLPHCSLAFPRKSNSGGASRVRAQSRLSQKLFQLPAELLLLPRSCCPSSHLHFMLVSGGGTWRLPHSSFCAE